VRLFGALIATAAGTAIAVALIALYGAAEIGTAIRGAGWGILALVAYHLVQIVFSALALQALLPQQRFATISRLRWIREAVNALLPVAQIGGEVVGARLLRTQGVTLAAVGATVAVDLILEMMSQVAFTLLGLAILLRTAPQLDATRWIAEGTIIAAGIVLSLWLAKRLGIVQLLERILVSLSDRVGWAALGEVRGLHAAVGALYRQPVRLSLGFMHHLISWLLGGFEVMLALYLLGVPVDLGDALVIESLGQATRAMGFFVPGAMGVQEAGNILVCGLVGIGPQAAIELSLLRRIREVALGIPGLLAWHILERRLILRRGRAAAPPRQWELLP
jgi:putative membrane protein